MSITAPASPDAIKDMAFETALRRRHITSGQRCLMVVDAAQIDNNEVLQALYATTDAPVWHWLFDDSALSLHADAGPVVVETRVNSEFCSHAIQHWAEKGLVFIVSEQPADSLLAGLRQMLWVDLETFGPTILRAYDSRFLQLLAHCQPELLVALMGAGTTWLWSIDMQYGSGWTGYRTGASSHKLRQRFGREFERLLGWVSGWPQCKDIASPDSAINAAELSAFIATQYHAEREIPDNRTILEGLWQAYRNARH